MNNFEEVYKQYAPMIYRLAYTYMKNKEDSEDIVQNVFIKWLKHQNFKNEDHQRYWLIVTCENECKNYLKHWWKRRKTLDENIADYHHEDDFSLILNLPDNLKTIVYLYYYEGYNSKEIGQILHKSDSTIRSQLQQARKLLKEDLYE